MATYVTKPTAQDFIYSLVKKWSSGVSGGLSVPFTIALIFAPNPNAKLLFGLLAITSMAFASYSLWSQEREERINTQDELDSQTAKLGRPEITVGLKNDEEKGWLWVCLMNYSDRAAVNVRIDEIACGDYTLGFSNPPNQLTSGFSPNIQVYCVGERGESKYDVRSPYILSLNRGTNSAFECLQFAVHYTDSGAEHEWVTFGRFFYNSATKAFDLEKQWVEQAGKSKPVLTV